MNKFHGLKDIRRIINKNKMLYKILASYIVIVVFGFTMFAVVLSRAFMHSAEQEMRNTTNAMVMQSYHTEDVLLKHNFTYYYDLFFEDSEIIRGLYAEQISDKETVDIYTYLKKTADNDIITDSVYLYNGTQGKIYSSIPGEYKLEDFYDQEVVGMIKDQTAEQTDVYQPRTLRVSVAGRARETSVITYILSEDLDQGVMAHALIVNIDQSAFQKMISGPLEDMSINTLIMNKQRIIISSSNDKLLQTTMDDEYVDTILAAQSGSGEISLKDYYISYQKSDMLNWYYIGMADYDDILVGFRHIYKIVFVAVLLFILLGLLAASISTTRIYMPIYTLLKDMRQKVKTNQPEEAKNDLNEYEYLSSTFENLLGDMTALKDQLEISNQHRKDILLLEILTGEYNKANSIEVWKAYGINLDAPFFRVLRFDLDDFRSFCRSHSSKDVELCKFAIRNVAEETLMAYYQVDSVEDGDSHVAMIVQIDNNSVEADQSFREHLHKVRDNLTQAIPWASISIAAGPCVSGHSNIPSSYAKAQIAMSFRLFWGREMELVYEDIPELANGGAPYPEEEEKELISALRQKNEKRVDTALNSLFDAFKQYRPDEVTLMINQIMLNVVRKAASANSRGDGETVDWRTFIDQINHFDTLDDMKTETVRFLHSLEQMQNTTSSADRRNEVVEKVTQYVAEHYGDRDLSVECLSDYVDLSTNYLRRIFKDSMGLSVSEYILNTRIEKAKQLMLTTDYTAKSIASMVGYADSRYFYVVFKRCTGMTAEEFRKCGGK